MTEDEFKSTILTGIADYNVEVSSFDQTNIFCEECNGTGKGWGDGWDQIGFPCHDCEGLGHEIIRTCYLSLPADCYKISLYDDDWSFLNVSFHHDGEDYRDSDKAKTYKSLADLLSHQFKEINKNE